MHYDIEVTMESGDKHIYQFTMSVTDLDNLATIRNRANKHMVSKDWENYGYKLKRIELC